MNDYRALAAIVWPDDGYATRNYAGEDADRMLARIARFQVTPWPAVELFPRIAQVERFVADWRSRIANAAAALREGRQ